METERIVLDVEEGPAVAGVAQANAALGQFEKRAVSANEAASRAAQSSGEVTIKYSDRGRAANERFIASLERRAKLSAAKSPLERLDVERNLALQRVSGDPQAVDRVRTAFERLSEAQRDAGKESATLGQQLGALGLRVASTIVSFQALKAILKIAVLDTSLFAAKTDTMAVALKASARANEVSYNELRKQEAGLRSQGIATQEARQSLLRMVTAQIDLSKATQLGRLAQNAAVIGLMNSSEAFEQLIYGIQSGQPRVLRTIGINVDFQESYQRLAKQLHKTTLELSDEEKVQARVNEVLRVAPRFAGIYAEAMGSVGKQITSLKRHFDDAQNSVGEKFQPALERVVATLEKLLKLIAAHPELGLGLAGLATAGTLGVSALGAGGIFGGARGLAAVGGVLSAAAIPTVIAGTGIMAGYNLSKAISPLTAGKPSNEQVAAMTQRMYGVVSAPTLRDVGIRGEHLTEQQDLRNRTAAFEAYLNSLDREFVIRRKITQAEQQQKDAETSQDKIAHYAATQRIKSLKAELELLQERDRRSKGWGKAYGEMAAKQTQAHRKELEKQTNLQFEKTGEEIVREIEARGAGEEKLLRIRTATLDKVEALTGESVRRQEDYRLQRLKADEESQVRQLDLIETHTVAQKIAVEQRKTAIEADYLQRRLEMEIEILKRRSGVELLEAQKGITDRQALDEIHYQKDQELDAKVKLLKLDSEDQIRAVHDQGAVRSAQILISEHQKAFDRMKSGFEGLFDAAFERSRSFVDALKNMFFAVFLTPIKEQLSTLFASMFTGRGATLGGVGRGTGIASLAGGLLLSPGAGFGYPGAPGGTPGFAGPVNLGGIPAIGRLFGLGGSYAPIQSYGGISTVALQPGAPANIGTSLAGSAGLFAHSGFGTSAAGSAASGGLFLGGSMLAMKGLQRGGLSGLGMSTAGGAMMGFSVGGSLGAQVGALIGAGAGLIRMLFGGAEKKIVEKVRSLYGVSISRQFARDPLLPLIKQNFGGNVDVGIRSQQARELIELYAMSTGQNSVGIVDRARSLNLMQSGGKIYETPSFQSGQELPRLTSSGSGIGAQPQAVTIVNQFTMPAEAVNAAFDGRTQTFISRNVRTVASAGTKAMRQSFGRQQNVALSLSPSTLIS